MKNVLSLILIILVLPTVLSIDIEVEKLSSNEVIINGLNLPAIFDLNVKNKGISGNFEFYNLLGFSMAPKGTVFISQGETKNVRLTLYPREDFNYKGFYTFEYFIRSDDKSQTSKKLTIKIIDLGGAFEIGSGEVYPETNSIDVFIHNKVNFNFSDLNLKFNSAFFDFEESLSLGPFERKDFTVELNKEDFKKLTAGFYTLNVQVSVEDEKANVEGIIKFVEQDILTITKSDYGFIINTQIINKKNDGNVIVDSETVINKNIISRLFTTFSPEPDIVERDGFKVYYTWDKKINPGETLEIIVKTNWFFPLLIIFFIISIVLLAKQYSKTYLILRKRVSFVKAKGGEFALKISIIISARKHIERVNIVDRLPPLVKVYEKFGGEKPLRINEKNRKIEWEFSELRQGEKRILTYIIYSKVGIVGKFVLPKATAVYERDEEIYESSSNKAYFIAEQRKKDLDE